MAGKRKSLRQLTPVRVRAQLIKEPRRTAVSLQQSVEIVISSIYALTVGREWILLAAIVTPTWQMRLKEEL